LSAFFALLALIAYARFVEESKAHPPSSDSGAMRSPKSKVFYVLALLAFACGLMSKPMLVTLPFVLLLIDFWPLGRIASSEISQPSTFNLQPSTNSRLAIWQRDERGRTRRRLAQLGRNPAVDVGLRRHRAHEQTIAARAKTHREFAGGNS
jgi:hypothetical protein